MKIRDSLIKETFYFIFYTHLIIRFTFKKQIFLIGTTKMVRYMMIFFADM